MDALQRLPGNSSPFRKWVFRHRWILVVTASLALAGGVAWAGAYIFAGETYGINLILHPVGYTGPQDVLDVEVWITPTTPLPAGVAITDVETPIKNNIAIWNQLQPMVGNALRSNSNNIPNGKLDFESVALHEMGHCIGLAHVNAASESGLPGSDSEYTKATNGIDNMFNLNPGTDGIRATFDDVRGDDVNLHWFRTDTNNPGQLPLPTVVDATTYDRDQASLPGANFAANLERTAAASMGHPSAFPVYTEAVMQQGTWFDEDQRRLTADGVASILLAASGLDETAGTADDYVLNLVYGGISAASSCDISVQLKLPHFCGQFTAFESSHI